ncbi:MAG: hypothetical protein R2932_35060 [Caldilineaceae bacterium]
MLRGPLTREQRRAPACRADRRVGAVKLALALAKRSVWCLQKRVAVDAKTIGAVLIAWIKQNIGPHHCTAANQVSAINRDPPMWDERHRLPNRPVRLAPGLHQNAGTAQRWRHSRSRWRTTCRRSFISAIQPSVTTPQASTKGSQSTS